MSKILESYSLVFGQLCVLNQIEFLPVKPQDTTYNSNYIHVQASQEIYFNCTDGLEILSDLSLSRHPTNFILLVLI